MRDVRRCLETSHLYLHGKAVSGRTAVSSLQLVLSYTHAYSATDRTYRREEPPRQHRYLTGAKKTLVDPPLLGLPCPAYSVRHSCQHHGCRAVRADAQLSFLHSNMTCYQTLKSARTLSPSVTTWMRLARAARARSSCDQHATAWGYTRMVMARTGKPMAASCRPV